ncbi:MAG: Dabb family protein [Solirubrobacteraceae bacterium]
MIRNVVLVELRPDRDPAEAAAIQDGFRCLRCPGTLSYALGSDLGLKAGNWSFAIVADFTDADSLRGYDADDEQKRLRAALAPLAVNIARGQFEVAD